MKKLNKTLQSTVEKTLAKLTPKQRKKYDEEYTDLLWSEMMLAMMAKDHEHVSALAKEIGISSKKIHALYANEQQDYNFQAVFKILKQFGCTQFTLKLHGKDINIALPAITKK